MEKGDYRSDYYPTPDWVGNRECITVSFDRDDRVNSWRVIPLPRTRPPWLDRVMKTFAL